MSAQTSARQSPQPPGGDGAHILVAGRLENDRYLIEQVLLRQGFRVSQAADGPGALEQIRHARPDLVLLDAALPYLDGYQVLKALRADRETELLPVILLTVRADGEARRHGLDVGATDFLDKPCEAGELLARVRAHLRIKTLAGALARAEEVLFMLARVVEARDAYGPEHTARVAQYAQAIAAGLNLSTADTRALRRGAMLHDIGMIALPDTALRKGGPLDDGEWKRVRQHPAIGATLLASWPSLGDALAVVHHHHERWDGQGYPQGLAGEQVPLLARIASIADAFDAMTSDRPYRPRKSIAEARFLLEIGAGSTWEPRLVNLALRELPKG